MQTFSWQCTVSSLVVTTTLVAAAPDPGRINGEAPVAVSAANYRRDGRAAVERAVNQTTVNPDAPARHALGQPEAFVFLPGEISLPDPANPEPTYETVCALLTPALASQGYLNAADERGIIRRPDEVKLVLRLHYGQREWRLPVVRTDRLTWRDGLAPTPHGRSLTTLGGDVVWDNRAGGNDRATSALAQNDANTNSFFGSGGGAASASEASGAAPLANGTGDTMGLYGDTREFFIIVIDAFDYAELKTKGKAATRLWTTFVSAPTRRHQRFADVMALLIRNATPFFGETSPGLQVYTDARAEVTLGDATVVEDAPAP